MKRMINLGNTNSCSGDENSGHVPVLRDHLQVLSMDEIVSNSHYR